MCLLWLSDGRIGGAYNRAAPAEREESTQHRSLRFPKRIGDRIAPEPVRNAVGMIKRSAV